jgi:hypothetical protein
VEVAPSRNALNRKRVLFWVGLLIYVVSFAPVALVDRDSGGGLIRGFRAAVLSIWVPLAVHPFQSNWPFRDMKLEYVALLISGLINPLFVTTLIVRRNKRAITALRIFLFLMFPFCWVVFYCHPLHPREGYFVWLFGMVLTLFSMP